MDFGFSGRVFQFIAVLLAFTALAVFAVAQSSTDGAINGTVYDPQGAVVPNAKVTVHNNSTGAEQTVQTDASGNYRVTTLQPSIQPKKWIMLKRLERGEVVAASTRAS